MGVFMVDLFVGLRVEKWVRIWVYL